MDLEHKFCRIGDEITVSDGHVIEGYASLFGRKDQGGDVVAKGAYGTSLSKTKARIKMLWQHDPAQPIGVWDDVREDEKGLFVKGRILTDVAKGRDVAALIAAGAIDGLSIGYRALKASKDKTGARVLSELELWEVSLVTFPMQVEARVSAKGDALHTDRTMANIVSAFNKATAALRSA